MDSPAQLLRKQIQQWALDLLRPSAFVAPFSAPPPFLKEAEVWELAYQYVDRLHASLPFLMVVERAEWHRHLPSLTQRFFGERQSRERMGLALLDWEMEEALAILSSAAVPVILLKGMDVGRRFYPERVFRPMADADLLVRPRDFAKAAERLEQRGFSPVGIPYPGRFRMEFSRGKGRPVVELHSYLLSGDDNRDMKRIWQRAEESNFDLPGNPKVLGLEDQLFYLGGHAIVQHLLESPVWLNDLVFLLEGVGGNPDFSWDRLLQRIDERFANTAFWFLFSVLEKWGAAVPAEPMARLAAKAPAVRRSVLAGLLEPRNFFPYSGKGWLMTVSARFLLKDSAFEAVRYVVARQKIRSFTSRFLAGETP